MNQLMASSESQTWRHRRQEKKPGSEKTEPTNSNYYPIRGASLSNSERIQICVISFPHRKARYSSLKAHLRWRHLGRRRPWGDQSGCVRRRKSRQAQGLCRCLATMLAINKKKIKTKLIMATAETTNTNPTISEPIDSEANLQTERHMRIDDLNTDMQEPSR